MVSALSASTLETHLPFAARLATGQPVRNHSLNVYVYVYVLGVGLKGNLGKNTSLVYMKVHEHSSTSVINREALELHTKRNLKLQLVNGTCTEAGQPPSWI